MSQYRERFRSEERAHHYDQVIYAPGTYDAHISELQLRWLRNRVESVFTSPPIHVDIACGSGRVLTALSDLVYESIGVDTSREMLALASRNAPGAVLIHLDDNANSGVVTERVTGGREVLVTMFRLILNATDADRDSCIGLASSVLRRAKGGLLAVNNHGNSLSLRQLARFRQQPSDQWLNFLSEDEVREMLCAHGLEIRGRFGAGIVPAMAFRVPGMGPLARAVNRATAGESAFGRMSVDVTYLAGPTVNP